MSVVEKIYRGTIADTARRASISVCDGHGRILYSLGDAFAMVFARSSAKPLQAIPVIESGAPERFALTDAEIALICASHSGQPLHVDGVRSMLQKGGLTDDALLCGPVYPMNEDEARAVMTAGKSPAAIYSDCSGKHAGMLLTALMHGDSIENYMDENHPVQKRITTTLAEVCDFAESGMAFAIDGCGVPVHAMPLCNVAQGYARLSTPDIYFAPDRAQAAHRIVRAMGENPFYVGGTNRMCTLLMEAFSDRLIGKVGADGFYGIGILDHDMGIAMKMEDGSLHDLLPILCHILVQLDVISPELAVKRMGEHIDSTIKNAAGTPVGRRELCFSLTKHWM